MGEQVVQHGLEGVIAFETQIAEPDREGSALRYRGVDIEDLVGAYDYGHVWGLLVDGIVRPRPAAGGAVPDPRALGRHPRRRAERAGDARSVLGLPAAARHRRHPGPRRPGPRLGDGPVVRRPVRPGLGLAMVPQKHIDGAEHHHRAVHAPWRGDPDPKHVKAVDAYWVSAAEHGMNASTFTARVIASTGADVAAALSGAVGALSGPLHGGAPPVCCRCSTRSSRKATPFAG